MLDEIYSLVLEALYKEIELHEDFVGGVATPLGAGPKGKVNYRDSDDKTTKSKKTKKRKNSVQYHLNKKN